MAERNAGCQIQQRGGRHEVAIAAADRGVPVLACRSIKRIAAAGAAWSARSPKQRTDRRLARGRSSPLPQHVAFNTVDDISALPAVTDEPAADRACRVVTEREWRLIASRSE